MSRGFASFWPGFGTGGAMKRDLSNLAPHPDSSKHTMFVRGDGTLATPATGAGVEWVSMPADGSAAGAPGQKAYADGVIAEYIGLGGDKNWIFYNAFERSP